MLTALAGAWCRAARAERPGLVVSAAVVPDEAQAVHQKLQDWPAWLARGLLDAVCPMAYTPDSRIFRAQVEQARAPRAARARALWAGVGRLPADASTASSRRSSWRARRGRRASSLFSHESLRREDLRRLRPEAFAGCRGPRRAAGDAAGRAHR